MRVLVTGAAGFVGRRLVPFLEKNGCQVYALSRSERIGDHPLVLRETTAESLAYVLQGIGLDAVINLAAAGVRPDERNIEVLTRVNAILPCDILAAASRCGARVFLQAGSSAEYAAHQGSDFLTEESAIGWEKSYGATKAVASRLLPLWGHEYGIRVAVLRLFNIFGPGESAHRLFPSLVTRLVNGESVPMSVGTQVRDFLHVDDACRALLDMLRTMLENPEVGGAFNLASGIPMSVADFARCVAKAVGAPEHLLMFGALALRPDDLPYVVGDASKLRTVCGWVPGRDTYAAIDAAVAELMHGMPRRSCA